MPFITSFLSGLTLTTGLLYGAVIYHQRSRMQQAAILRTSALQLNTMVDPRLASEIATMEDENYSGGIREGIKDYRLVRKTGLERFKDGWNRELENGVRWFNEVELSKVREGLEQRVREWRGGERRV